MQDENNQNKENIIDKRQIKKIILDEMNTIKKSLIINNIIPDNDDNTIFEQNELSYQCIVEVCHHNILLKCFRVEFNKILKKIIYDTIKNKVDSNNDELLTADKSQCITKMKQYQNRNDELFILSSYGFEKGQIEELRSAIEAKNNFNFPGLILWNKNAIQFHFEYLEEKTIIWSLDSNKTIDNEYKETDGLHVFGDDELYNIISNKYFIVNISIKYQLKIDKDNIFYITRKDKQNN